MYRRAHAMRTSNSSNSNPCKHLLRLLRSPSKKRPHAHSPSWSRTPSWKARRATNVPSTPRRRKPHFVLPAAFRQSHIPSSTTGSATSSGLSSLTESMRDTAPFPTPRTPSMFVDLHGIVEDNAVEEDACRWFVWCLTEMMVEDGNPRDLRDVEELVGCWKELRSPVFVGLVCRFYVEVCMDLFFGGDGVALYDEEEDIVPIRT